jgi:hypothetical protein
MGLHRGFPRRRDSCGPRSAWPRAWMQAARFGHCDQRPAQRPGVTPGRQQWRSVQSLPERFVSSAPLGHSFSGGLFLRAGRARLGRQLHVWLGRQLHCRPRDRGNRWGDSATATPTLCQKGVTVRRPPPPRSGNRIRPPLPRRALALDRTTERAELPRQTQRLVMGVQPARVRQDPGRRAAERFGLPADFRVASRSKLAARARQFFLAIAAEIVILSAAKDLVRRAVRQILRCAQNDRAPTVASKNCRTPQQARACWRVVGEAI